MLSRVLLLLGGYCDDASGPPAAPFSESPASKKALCRGGDSAATAPFSRRHGPVPPRAAIRARLVAVEPGRLVAVCPLALLDLAAAGRAHRHLRRIRHGCNQLPAHLRVPHTVIIPRVSGVRGIFTAVVGAAWVIAEAGSWPRPARVGDSGGVGGGGGGSKGGGMIGLEARFDDVAAATGVAAEVARSYYYAGSQRVAMRVSDGVSGTVYYLHGDHGSSPKGELLGSLAQPNCRWGVPALPPRCAGQKPYPSFKKRLQ
jgi:hypothetical protein